MYGLKKYEIEELQNIFSNYPSIDKVLIFGSRAKGDYRLGSDIDLAIISKKLDFSKLLDIEVKIDNLFMPYRVDLIDYSKIKNRDLKAHIKRVGKPFYIKSLPIS